MIIPLASIFVAMLIIWKASDGFEAASNYLGRNLSDGVKGATINAIGSSMPELITAFIALVFYADKAGFAFGIGVTAGSAVFNAAVIPALVILSVGFFQNKVVKVDRKVILRDGLSLLLAELALIYLLASGKLEIMHGLILIGVYVLYMILTITTMKKTEPVEDDDDDGEIEQTPSGLVCLLTLDIQAFFFKSRRLNFGKGIFLLLISTAVIGGACHILVQACYSLGSELGIGTYFIAVILAAAATSIPDTVLSIKDASKGNYNDAVANALGSNIFDITICIGLPLVVYSLMTGQSVTLGMEKGSVAELRVLLLGLTAFIVLLFLLGKTMNKLKANLMLLGYAGFVTYIVARAMNNELALQISGYLHKALELMKGV